MNNFGGFSTLLCHIFCNLTLSMHTENQFWKEISPALLFLATMEAQTFCLRPGRVATAYSTDKYKCKIMKIRVSWVGQSTRVQPNSMSVFPHHKGVLNTANLRSNLRSNLDQNIICHMTTPNGHQLAPLTSVTKLATRWHHLHWFKMWSPGCK